MSSERLLRTGDVVNTNTTTTTIQVPEITSTSSNPNRSNNNPNLLRRQNQFFPRRRRSLRTLLQQEQSNRTMAHIIPFNPDQSIISSNANNAEKPKNESTRVALLSVALIFALSLMALFYVYMSFPELEDDEKQHIHLPWDIDGAKKLGTVLDRYKDKYFFEVLSGVCVTYIFLQTFAIPGSLFLSILSGFLFPFMLALLLVCCCSAIGASLCYLLSQLLGRRLVKKFFPERAEKWARAVHVHRDHIFNYILFLRMTPFLPNWFINLVAPVIGVPLVPFALGTFIGVGPPSFVAIQAGQTLYKMTSSNDAFSWSSVILLSVFALLSLVPVVLKKRLKDKFE